MDNIIELARDYLRSSRETYKRGNVWDKDGGNYSNLIRIVNTFNTPEEVIRELTRHDMYNITIRTPQKFDLMMGWNRDLLRIDKDPELVTTPNLYKMYFYCKNIKENTSKINTVLELGGGNGQFARIAKKHLGFKTHIDIDLPESLYMAYVCTRYWHPEAKCLWVLDETPINIEEYDFIFIPVQREGCIRGKNFDLFVNTASMGEMSNQNMRYWMNFLQKEVNLKYFFGFNRFLNTVPADPNDNWHRIRQNENETNVIYDRNWKPILWEVEPDFARCPIEDPRIARYLMILLERSDYKLDDDISDIYEHDFWDYREVGPLATHRDNQLVNDMKKGGTLYRLWNAIRMGNKEAVAIMLTYLKQLRRTDIIFEEELFYQKGLK